MHQAYYACNISGWHSMRILHCSAKCEPCDHDHRYARYQGNLLAQPPSQDSCQSKNWCAWPLGWIETVQVFLQFQVQSASSQSERNFLHRASAIGVHRGAASSLVLDVRVRKLGSVGSKFHPHEGSHTREHTRDNGTNSYELLPNSWKLFILGHLPIDHHHQNPNKTYGCIAKYYRQRNRAWKETLGAVSGLVCTWCIRIFDFRALFCISSQRSWWKATSFAIHVVTGCHFVSLSMVKAFSHITYYVLLFIYVWVQEIMFFCHKPCVSRITGGTAGERCFGVLEHYPNRPKVRCCSIWHWLNEELQLCLRWNFASMVGTWSLPCWWRHVKLHWLLCSQLATDWSYPVSLFMFVSLCLFMSMSMQIRFFKSSQHLPAHGSLYLRVLINTPWGDYIVSSCWSSRHVCLSYSMTLIKSWYPYKVQTGGTTEGERLS